MYILRIYRPESGYSSVFLCKTSLDYPNLKTYQSGKQIKYKQKESKIPNSITQRKKLYPTIEFSKPKNPQRTCLRLGIQTVNFTREQMTRMMLYR